MLNGYFKISGLMDLRGIEPLSENTTHYNSLRCLFIFFHDYLQIGSKHSHCRLY